MSLTDRIARLALAHLVEPGSRELGLLVRRVGAAEALTMVLHGVDVTAALAGAVRTRVEAAGLGFLPSARLTAGLRPGAAGLETRHDGTAAFHGAAGPGTGSGIAGAGPHPGGVAFVSVADAGGDLGNTTASGTRPIPSAPPGVSGSRGAPSADVWAESVAGLLAGRMEERAGQLGARIVTAADDEWPAALDDLVHVSREGTDALRRDTDPPLAMWLRGPVRLDTLLERSVSIVGARAASSYGEFVASEFSFGLAERGWSVVSGGALGIDVTAHRGALAAGGLTCAVLACGVDRMYPVSNSSVFERIADEGLLLTEWPPGTRPHRTRFLTRNRVIAAATRGTVMVEAGSRSGARNTLSYARLLQRPAMVVPGPITSAMSVGCHVELRHPQAILVTRVEEIVEEIGLMGELADPIQGENRPEDILDAIQARVLDAVTPRTLRTAEEIAVVAGVAGRDARRSLPVLEEHGFVVRSDDGYRLAPKQRP